MRLHLGGYFASYAAGRHWVEVDLKAPARLRDVLAELNIPAGEVYLVVVNGRLMEGAEVVVSASDEVRVLPPVDGGGK